MAQIFSVQTQAIKRWERARCAQHVRYIPTLIEVIGFVPISRSPYQPTLGEAFRSARQLRGLRVLDLASTAGLSRDIIYHIENGRRSPASRYDALEQALEISVREIFSVWANSIWAKNID